MDVEDDDSSPQLDEFLSNLGAKVTTSSSNKKLKIMFESTKDDLQSNQKNNQLTLLRKMPLDLPNVNVFPDSFQMINDLKSVIGVYKLDNEQGLEAETWINYVKHNLDSNKIVFEDIKDHFFIYLSKEFHEWFFKLKDDDKIDFEKFKSSFVNQSINLKVDRINVALMEEDSFIDKLKQVHASDNQMLNEINTMSLYTFMKMKFLSIKACFKSIDRTDLVLMAISMLKNKNTKNKIFKYRKADLADFLTYCKNIDLISKE